jgi:hypothetical protein
MDLGELSSILIPQNANQPAAILAAWALPLALKLNLGALGAWPKIEPKIIERLDDILRRANKDGTPLPVDLPTIEKAHRWLVMQFGLRSDLGEAPTFALRVFHYFKAKNRPRQRSSIPSFSVTSLVQVRFSAKGTVLSAFSGIWAS